MVREGNPFWIWEKEIPDEYCEELIGRTKQGEFQQAAVGSIVSGAGVVDKTTRDTNICWINDKFDPVSLLMFNYVLRANLNAEWFVELSGIEPIQLGQYKEGGFYKPHQDSNYGCENNVGLTRKLSIVLMLSDAEAYEGGDLVLRLSEDTVMPKQRGTIIVFPSTTYHTVTPVTKGERFTAVGWSVGKPWR